MNDYACTLFDISMSADEKLLLLNKSERRRSSWVFAEKSVAPLLEQLRKNPLPRTPEAGLIYSSSGKFVWKLNHETAQGPTVIAYKTNPGKTPHRYIFKSSLPVREVRNYFLFEKAGIPTAPVLAVGDMRKNFILHETFIITSFIEGSADGRIFMPGGDLYSDLENKEIFCKINLELLAKAHHALIWHKAFHPRNLLWRNTEKQMEIFWIDVARCRKVSAHAMPAAIIYDLHTFFKDMRLPRETVASLLEHYRKSAPEHFLPASNAQLLEAIATFKRRAFAPRENALFAD